MMSGQVSAYRMLSTLLLYPDKSFKEQVQSCDEALHCYPEALAMLAPFLEYAQKASISELEELHTKTFDIQALCHLDIGYVLFGEDYKRGSFLVQMKQEQKRAHNDYGSELPDHLPYVLTLLAAMSDPELASELAKLIVQPAVEKILQGFAKKGNVYGSVLKAVQSVLQQDYGKVETLPTFQQQEVAQ